VGVFVKVSLARVLPTAFTDKITDIDHYIKGDVYSSICSFRENGQETVKMYEIFLLERLQRCESAELLDGIIEEVAETVSRYAHYAQSIKNSDSILQWRNSAILMINKHISTEMLPVSECTYLPGAMLPAASSIEEKQNLLLNILLMGAVKMAYPREVLQMFGVNCPDERNFVLQKYNGLLFIVRSLLSDLEKAGNIPFRDEVIEQAKTSLNMGHFDFDRLLGEEEVEEVEEEESAETVKDVLLEQVVPVEERLEGNATEETQAVLYQGIFNAAVTLRSLQGVNMPSPALGESIDAGASSQGLDDSTQGEVSREFLNDVFTNENALTQPLVLDNIQQDIASRHLCAPKGDDMRSITEDEDSGSKTKKQKTGENISELHA
jgi:hypothetical protein